MNGRVLVGRQRELEALDAALARAARSERPVLFFSGEPGIGKTRLLEALAVRAVGAGAVVAWGRVWEVGLTPAFWPWLQVLGAIETPNDPAPPLGGMSSTASAAARLPRFGEVRAFLRRRAAIAPLVLLLDDLHAADLSSLELLDYLLPELLGTRVLIALAARESDARRELEHELGRILRSAERHPLSRLGPSEVEALVGGRAPAADVFALSEGNPLFVEELVACFLAGGALGLPRLSSVRAVIRERVAALPAETRRALAAAAVLGREFRASIVATMTGLAPLGTWLEPARALGVITTAAPPALDGFRFSHALVAEAIADEIEPPERAALHLGAARALIEHAPNETLAIAHQLLASGTLEPAAAARAAERAAREHMRRLAFEDAAALLERALGALELAGSGPPLYRAELLCQRAEALQHAARHAEAALVCDAALTLVRALTSSPASAPAGTSRAAGDIASADAATDARDAGVLFARIALARGLQLTPGLTDPRLVGLLAEALERLPPDNVGLRAQLLARLAAAEQPAPDPSGPVERALRAIELAAMLGPDERLNVSYVATAALVEYIEPERLEQLHREVLALARDNHWVSVHTRLRACFCALDAHDRAAFERAQAAFEAEANALALPQWLRHVHLLRALGALLDGDFERAEREADASSTLSRALGDASAIWRLDVHRSIAVWTRTTRPDPQLMARFALPPPGGAAVEAWFATQSGDAAGARAALAKLGAVIPADPDFATMMAHAVAFVGDSRRAAELYPVLATRTLRPVLSSMVGSAVLDLHARTLLVLAAAAGHFQAIDQHGRDALISAERLSSPVWAARVRADWADALVRRAAPGDAERARELHAAALDTAQRCGMPGLIARATPAPGPDLLVTASPAVLAEPSSNRVELSRHGALWLVHGQGESAHVKDSRGVRMLAQLVAEPGRPLHVLDLVGASGVDGGDAGTALDRTARDQYRRRLASLARAREEAEAAADQGRLARANAEIEMLSAELERAFGLGGRERRIGAASERARSNAQRRISHALEQIRAAAPRLGAHLTACVRTGTYCVYAPPA